MLPAFEPGESHAASGRNAGLQPLAVSAPGFRRLAEVDDRVLGRVLGQRRRPGIDHRLDDVPPGPESPFRQPLANVQARLELADRPVVGEAGVASVLPEKRLLLRRGPQCYAVGLLHWLSRRVSRSTSHAEDDACADGAGSAGGRVAVLQKHGFRGLNLSPVTTLEAISFHVLRSYPSNDSCRAVSTTVWSPSLAKGSGSRLLL